LKFKPQPFGKYLLLERIGIGGMAEIFKAKALGAAGFEKIVAIKRILPHLSQNREFISMLIHEAKLVVDLSHRNIVQVYDLGKVGDDYFMVLEFVEGMNLRILRQRLKSLNLNLSVGDAVFIAVEISKGLDYAHRKKDNCGKSMGIIHRDISPPNILLSLEGEVKIVDFGIAKATHKISETTQGMVKGKFNYMSPEQALGFHLDQRSDIFSMGILLYELLTQKSLFPGDNIPKILNQIKTFSLNPPFLPPEIPSELEFILERALQRIPDGRYHSAAEMLIDLNGVLHSSEVEFSVRSLPAVLKKLFKKESKNRKGKKTKGKSHKASSKTRQILEEAAPQVMGTRESTRSLFEEDPGHYDLRDGISYDFNTRVLSLQGVLETHKKEEEPEMDTSTEVVEPQSPVSLVEVPEPQQPSSSVEDPEPPTPFFHEEPKLSPGGVFIPKHEAQFDFDYSGSPLTLEQPLFPRFKKRRWIPKKYWRTRPKKASFLKKAGFIILGSTAILIGFLHYFGWLTIIKLKGYHLIYTLIDALGK